MPDSKQGEEEDTDVEKLVLGLRATAKAEAAAMVPPPVEMMALSAEERADIVAAILGEPATAGTRTTIPTGVTSLAEARRRRTRWMAVALPLAAAAGLALVVGLPPQRSRPNRRYPATTSPRWAGSRNFGAARRLSKGLAGSRMPNGSPATPS